MVLAVASSTSSVGTVGTVGTISVTSDEKQVEDTSKLADGYHLCVVLRH
jgi:hypothetical protein